MPHLAVTMPMRVWVFLMPFSVAAETPKIEGILGPSFFQQREGFLTWLCVHVPYIHYQIWPGADCPTCLCFAFLYFNASFFILFKFISGVLAALSAMISLEIPQINVMTKMDLLSKKAKKEIEK